MPTKSSSATTKEYISHIFIDDYKLKLSSLIINTMLIYTRHCSMSKRVITNYFSDGVIVKYLMIQMID